jgi:hypothetical protein
MFARFLFADNLFAQIKFADNLFAQIKFAINLFADFFYNTKHKTNVLKVFITCLNLIEKISYLNLAVLTASSL